MSTTIYMLLRHRCGEMVLSMFEIKIPKDETAEPHHLSAILEFPEQEYPRGMCSVQLGSEFYFLGGEHDLEDPRPPFDQWFPKDVYIFDPIDGKGSIKRGVSMNTGKCDPCAVVADGKIFVLSSSIAFDFTLPCYNEKGMPIDNSIRFFECFDPESDKWMVLDDPPIDIPIWWRFSFVGGRFIFFVGRDADGFWLLSVFNLDTLGWTSSTKVEKEKITTDDMLIFTAAGEDSSGKYLYGLHGYRNNRILRLGPLSNVDQNPRMFSSVPIKTISMMEEVDSFHKLNCSSFILHLGNRRFCYLLTGSPPRGFGFPATIQDDYSRTVKLFVFEETNCSASEFYPNVVYSASFEIKTSFINRGDIISCHILSPGEKHESMKRKQEDNWKHESMKRKQEDNWKHESMKRNKKITDKSCTGNDLNQNTTSMYGDLIAKRVLPKEQ
ncbi:uncharacterized protein LOC110640929 isoform X4 [Hevea brasiliensis]|uniref:uncharacterized protein LOC110640929 isoform X4 n=1 Tax=Hevea brasiliensis TaxID=3981 RepID=UPI0025D9054B|nr:uncharacterized protein LOC110640929 isoform X4 [Hevea brasiliensis]